MGSAAGRVFYPGLIKWGTRDGSEITRSEPRLRLIEGSPVITGFDKIPLTRPRLLYRMQYAVPATRNYIRLYRFAF